MIEVSPMKRIYFQRNTKNIHAGFTLIESLIYFTLLGIMLAVIGTILFQVLRAKTKAETIQEVSQNARVIMETISDSVRNAQSITNPIAGQSSSSLTLSMSDSAKNPTIFDTSNSLLRIKQGSSSAQVITSSEISIDAITFTNVSYPNTSGSIRIELSLSASNTTLFKEYEYEDTFYTTVTIRPR